MYYDCTLFLSFVVVHFVCFLLYNSVIFQKSALFLGFDGCLSCLVLIWWVGGLFGFRVCFFVVCVLLEVDFWIIFGCKKCAQTIFMYSSSILMKCPTLKLYPPFDMTASDGLSAP